ncbi:Anti-sigma regulatory factor (Ser/Thr protein kinase) [Micromonospora nigra]|uniref:Anti-sigma regulatory factor (Ser/Thr protein kinase) n=1 Tax=Micromonospora nigra TaxID=145857 RepID=A0A1C6SZU6_9ACTN|nr:ATP-binding protein [Micromonospora nigra]SCL34882.1 Anti-sigma regulatory factor (Ser/Thr protein kinase) [Micromonospora nigra]
MSDEGPTGHGVPMVTSAPLLSRAFTAATVTELRHQLASHVAAAGLTDDPGDDFVLAVHELVTNAVRHGGGAGRLLLVRRGDLLVCEVSDDGPGDDDLTVDLPATNVPGGRGLWLAHRLTGALSLTSRPGGVTATVTARLPTGAGGGDTGPR